MPPSPLGPDRYGEAYADVYDEWYPPDAELATCVEVLAGWAQGGPVLELGVGTGRLAHPLVARGIPVVGVDVSAAMLARLRSRAPATGRGPRAVRADMARLPVRAGAGLPLVVASRNTLANLTGPGAMAACVAAAASALAPGGRLAVDLHLPDPDAPAGPSLAVGRLTREHVVLHVTDHRPGDGLVVGQQVDLGPEGVRLRPWALRSTTPDELDGWAAAAGLALEHRWEGWDATPWTGDATRHVSVWRRAPDPVP